MEFDNQVILTQNNNPVTVAGWTDGPSIPFSCETTLHELFEERAAQTPDAVALLFGGQEMTYAECNRKANQLADCLRQAGIGRGNVVAIMLDRSFFMITGILGILKAGAAYLPVAPSDPEMRKVFVFSSSGAAALVTTSSLAGTTDFNGPVILADDPALEQLNPNNQALQNEASDLAYIIYTSGSTGQPKGVMIEHRSVVNRLKWMQWQYPLNESDVLLQKTAFNFDVSVWELFWWTLAGARLSILAPGAERIPFALTQAISETGVTILHFVPSMFNAFLDYLDGSEHLAGMKALKRIFTSGEALLPAQVDLFNRIFSGATETRLTNLYGPTEATVDVTYFDCPPGLSLPVVPIGKPITGIQMLIIRKEGQYKDDDCGELGIAGIGLARGYLNRPDLTGERFIPHPFLPHQKIYLTGDQARLLPDGNIEYLGRLDSQVKIRGLRIELQEIESVLMRQPAIREGAVILRKGETEDRIEAFVSLKFPIEIQEIKQWLRGYLPEYMIPNIITIMKNLPVTNNGKLDRGALAETLEEEMQTPADVPNPPENDRTLPFTKARLEAIAEKFPPPFHIYDESRIIRTAQWLKSAFDWQEESRCYFAIKATPNPSILRVLMRQGYGADCSSLAELTMAEACGLRGEQITFSANIPPAKEFIKAMELGALINLDDITQIEFLEKAAGRLPEVISLRYNPGSFREGNVFLGELTQAKFGCTLEQLFEGYRILKEKGVKRFGLHTMIATQMLDPDFFIKNAEMLIDTALNIAAALDISFEFINLGGGIGVPYRPGQRVVDLDYMGRGIREIYQRKVTDKGYPPIRIYSECGRMLTAQSGYFVARVIHKKNTYKNYLGLDASMANLMRIGMYGEHHHITIIGKEDQPATHTYDIIGSLCENNDKFAIDRQLPHVEMGDLVVVHDTGGHGHAMGFNYNGKLRSAELLLRPDGDVVQIRRPETLDNLFATVDFNIPGI